MMTSSIISLHLILAIVVTVKVIGAFSPNVTPLKTSTSSHLPQNALFSTKNDIDVSNEWTLLTDDGGVKMRIISPPSTAAEEEEEGDSTLYPGKGKDVTVDYVGSIAARNWSVNDINACWLPEQGLTPLAPELFKAFNIDGKKLMDPKKFNKQFIFEGLGVLKEAKINNLVKAVQDLALTEKKSGTVFDKNRFTFRLGKGMSIQAFDLALAKMKVGETATLVSRCDYAYGKKGLRSAGKVLVPPYATVEFDLTLVEIK